MTESQVVVGIVNSSPDIVRLLRVALDRAGFVTFVFHIESIRLGEADVEPFLREHDPRVIVYDIAPPYDQNWRFLDHLRTATHFRGRQFVLTSTNVERLREVVGLEESVYEIVGRPDDIDAIVRAVKEASRARPTR
jgi:DNA-binding response OmpR family regulator